MIPPQPDRASRFRTCSRRELLRTSGAAAGALAVSGFVAAPVRARPRRRSLILLWLEGGPSHLETFDPKPGAPLHIRGCGRAESTPIDGMRLGELPRLAKLADRLALIRGIDSGDDDHSSAAHRVLTGRTTAPDGAWPSFPALLARAVAGGRFHASAQFYGCGHGGVGSLGEETAPLLLGTNGRTRNEELARKAQASPGLRQQYGHSGFGQACLAARVVVEQGPAVVVVALAGWDAHAELASRYRRDLLPIFDAGSSALIRDLEERGMLGDTLVAAVGEFGRAPRWNDAGGRDHWPAAGSALLAGGGVRGGQIVGATDRYGEAPVDEAITPMQFIATIGGLMGAEAAARFRGPDGGMHEMSGKADAIATICA